MKRTTWIFLGGVATGLLGASILSANMHNVKPVAKKLVAKGLCIKDKLATIAESAKESIEDIIAEAEEEHENLKRASATRQSEPENV